MRVKKTGKQLDADIAKALATSQLYVEGRGHPAKNGYTIYWTWRLRRGDGQIDSGALSGGDIPEFYESRPDYEAQKDINAQMKKIVRAWLKSGEFGRLDRSTQIFVSSTLP